MRSRLRENLSGPPMQNHSGVDTSFDLSKMSRDETYAVADVACVMPDGQGAGAAIVFFYRDGVFTAVAHEGEIRQFEQAMQARDLLARFLSSVI